MVRFGLTRDPDSRAPDSGWPHPVDSEGLWAGPLGDGRYRLENTPWFAENLSNQDIVEAVEHEGTRWITRKAHWSGHLTVRVTHRDPLDPAVVLDPAAVLDAFADLGVRGESAAPAYRIIALDIPPDADLRAILSRLRSGRSDGTWDFEEACVSTEWRGR
ncbi:hypothetical protein Adu01nite_65810 [Paractinoplanes durhamensis]|uniref:DUF4265 domain-containing protein n=2 Tax=Paractinoplanes durhamensis TaxID=113563 RepID=A0ABQ3Z5X9_9ACTN|nr:hypothetical protein Adu01nite_65810 [Actinoplanes durhamensis]